MAHQEDKPYPWHQGAVPEELGNGIAASSTDDQGLNPAPKIEEADEIDERYPAEDILAKSGYSQER
jgi:hypothetical protein